VLANRGGKRFYELVAAANTLFILVWVYSRTAGLPFGDNANVAESVGAVDTVSVILQVGVVLVAIRLVLAPEKRSIGRLAPALCAVAALGLATSVITSPDAATHNHDDAAAAEPTGLDAEAIKVDAARCDTDFNPSGYWAEADQLGIDTRWAGAPPAVAGAAAMSADGHAHGGTAAASTASTTTSQPDPFDGRGSPGLDDLVSATALAATSEVDAASLVTRLSEASQEDYDAWLWWLRWSGTLSHDHATSATTSAEDGSGHGGHVGPQPWMAMTDQKECDQLSGELDEARETAQTYATAKDAQEAGYRLVTPYLPGIAAHWINNDLIDGTFEVDKPEMLLYDGNGLDAHVVGLSYYLWHAGNNKPTQGFTGNNDHAHRHLGLCTSKTSGTVIGDSATTDEDCEARGGSKSDGSKGWMSHAWVVPGCESPWGVFSAASPLLDSELPESSGKDDGGCAGSGVRDRYGMDESAAAAPSSSEDEGATGTTGGG
jgi:hypothetical protein